LRQGCITIGLRRTRPPLTLALGAILVVLRIVVAALVLSSYAHGADPVPAELAGSWTLSEQSAGKLPSGCRNSRLVFTSDGKLISFNGDLRFVTKISIKKRNEGFDTHQHIVEHNGRPNCQGRSADYIVAHFVQDVYFERAGTLLRQYIWTKESGRFVEWVRTGST
jgi:hypothetical protein